MYDRMKVLGTIMGSKMKNLELSKPISAEGRIV